MKDFLRIETNVLKQIDEAISRDKTVQAIKLLRQEEECKGMPYQDLKDAINKRAGKSHAPIDAMDIKPAVSIKSVIIDLGDGTAEISLDEMSMKALMEMHKIGIDETQRVLDLHDMLTKWDQGISATPPDEKEEE